MKRNLLALFLCLGAMAAFNANSNGQTLIHYWNFNSFTATVTLPAIADLPADYTAISSPTAAMIYQTIPGTSSSFSDYCDETTDPSDTVNAQMGAAPGNCFRARNPSDSMELLFFIPSTGYTNLVFKYATQSSSYTSGDSIQVFSYSIDSGATWITSGSGLSEWIDSAQLIFTLKTITINDTAANNNDKLVFRIQTQGRNSGTSGNNRYDNVTLFGTGSTSTGVAKIQNYTVYNLYPNPVANSLKITSTTDGEKSVRIMNTIGQIVYTGTENGTRFSINTANLSTGNYFIAIHENTTGEMNTMKFIKQ